MARAFPCAVRRPAVAGLAGLLACLVALSPQLSMAADSDHLRDKKHTVERRIDGAHDSLDETSAGLRRASAALQRAQARLDDAQAHLAHTQAEVTAALIVDRQMQARLDAARAELAQARAELADGRRQLADRRDQLGSMAAQSYQSGDAELMRLTALFSHQDYDNVTMQLNTAQNLLDREATGLDRLRASQVLLRLTEERVHEAQQQVAVRRAAAAAQLAKRQTLEQQAAEEATQVQGLVAARSQARAAAEKARQRDLVVLRDLQRERDRIAAVLQRRAEAARRRAEAAAARRLAARRVAPSATGSGSGFLSAPIAGYVTSDYGWRIHPIFGYRSFHDGIDFGAGQCGVAIHAAASGTVVERYYQSAYGNRLIVDHGWVQGGGLATIYNHATRYVVSPGQHVSRGQVIGYVGDTGWSTGCHLHFTVLRNGSPVDPHGWL